MASQVLVSTPNFFWRIENFPSTYQKVSPTFTATGLRFRLKYSRYMEFYEERLQLIMECLDHSRALPTREFKVGVSVFDEAEDSCLDCLGNYSLQFNEWCVWSQTFEQYNEKCYENSRVIFTISFSPVGNLDHIFEVLEHAEKSDYGSPCVQRFSEDIGKLFNNAEHGDFTLKCGNRSFFVHRSVLSARSRFFAAMLRSDMKETNEGCGTVENIEPDILEVVLRYLYTGIVPELSVDAVQKIYAAADRFLVEPLQLKSLSLLMSNFITGEDSHNNTAKESDSHPKDENNIQPMEMDREARRKEVVKELFMTREWKLLSEEFPNSAAEMCKPYLLRNFCG